MRPADGVVGVHGALEDWVRSHLVVVDITAFRERPWAKVWRVTASDGAWWLKVNSQSTGYETRLLDLFSTLQQPLVPESLSHPVQPWALIRDAGRSLREHLSRSSQAEVLDFWTDLLPRYAELQQSIRVSDLFAIGVPDLSPLSLATQFDRILSESDWFRIAYAPDYSSAIQERVHTARSELIAIAAELAEGLAPTVQHDDLHDGNVFTSGAGPQIIDWGDAVIAHPFATLRVTLVVLSDQLQVGPDDPVLPRVSDAYLEAWRHRGESFAELRRQLDLALRVAGLGRALGWARALGTPEAGEPLGFSGAVADWMGQFADDVLGADEGDL